MDYLLQRFLADRALLDGPRELALHEAHSAEC